MISPQDLLLPLVMLGVMLVGGFMGAFHQRRRRVMEAMPGGLRSVAPSVFAGCLAIMVAWALVAPASSVQTYWFVLPWLVTCFFGMLMRFSLGQRVRQRRGG